MTRRLWSASRFRSLRRRWTPGEVKKDWHWLRLVLIILGGLLALIGLAVVVFDRRFGVRQLRACWSIEGD
jgi:hypothetical protein